MDQIDKYKKRSNAKLSNDFDGKEEEIEEFSSKRIKLKPSSAIDENDSLKIGEDNLKKNNHLNNLEELDNIIDKLRANAGENTYWTAIITLLCNKCESIAITNIEDGTFKLIDREKFLDDLEKYSNLKSKYGRKNLKNYLQQNGVNSFYFFELFYLKL